MAVGKPYSGDALVRRYLGAARRLAVFSFAFCLTVAIILPALVRDWPLLQAIGLDADGSLVRVAPLLILGAAALALNSYHERLADSFGMSRE